eukprot:scaffold528200_cov67-Attheya_sp.AAC.1
MSCPFAKKPRLEEQCPPTKEVAADVLGNPPFTPEILAQRGEKACYGDLEELEGVWVSYKPKGSKDFAFGLHTTCVPSPGQNPESIPGKFHFLCENYTERMEFTLLKGAARNRAGANEQLTGAVKYEQTVTSAKTQTVIHEEVGMYMWLADMYNHPASAESIKQDIGFPELSPGDGSKSTFIPAHTIARSGTIPHGQSIMLLGKPKNNAVANPNDPTYFVGKPEFPEGLDAWDFDHLAISPSMGGAGGKPINLDEPAPCWAHDLTMPHKDPSGNKTYTQRILANELYPYSVRPDLRLRDTIKDQNITGYRKIQLDTEFDHGQGPQGGILNTPMVLRNTPVKKMTLNMWIEDVIDEDGNKIKQLQYEQVMLFAFSFGTDGGTTLWPHIQVNTLRHP